MAKKVKDTGPRLDFVLDDGALRDIRKLPAGMEHLNERAKKIRDIASDNGRVDGYIATKLVLEDPRAASSVLAFGYAYNHNRKYNAIVKALNQVRD